jgi:hypothetical protein
LRETREIISRELFGHYDITNLAVLKIEPLQDRIRLGHDYGLVTVTLTFATKRNTTKHPNLNPDMFEPGNAMCQGWLYLHCGVSVGHVFDGNLTGSGPRGVAESSFAALALKKTIFTGRLPFSWKDEKGRICAIRQTARALNNVQPHARNDRRLRSATVDAKHRCCKDMI